MQRPGPSRGPRRRPRPYPAGADPLLTVLGRMTDLAAGMIDRLSEFDGSRALAALQPAPPNGATELRQLMIRAFFATAGSSLRYWRTLAELYAQRASQLQSQAPRAFGELPPSQAERVLLDEVRALFRELADVGLTEAARLGAELEQIGGALLEAAGATEPSGPYRRRWKAKD